MLNLTAGSNSFVFSSVEEFDAFTAGWRFHSFGDSRQSVMDKDAKNAQFHRHANTPHHPMLAGYDARAITVKP